MEHIYAMVRGIIPEDRHFKNKISQCMAYDCVSLVTQLNITVNCLLLQEAQETALPEDDEDL